MSEEKKIAIRILDVMVILILFYLGFYIYDNKEVVFKGQTCVEILNATGSREYEKHCFDNRTEAIKFIEEVTYTVEYDLDISRKKYINE
jgi:hypothetical protein